MRKIILSALMIMGVMNVTKAADWNMYDTKVPLDSIITDGGRISSKVEVEYQNGNISCLTYYYKTGETWDLRSRQQYSYDAQGREIELLMQSFTDGAWVNDTKTTRTYGVSNAQEPSLILTEYWYKAENKWINQTKSEVTFNGAGLPTDYHMYTWVSDAWSAIQWNQIKYNEQNQRSESYLLNWLIAKNDWVNSMRYIYYYDDRGNTIKTTSDEWDQTVEPNDWTLVNTEEVEYNDDNKPILITTTREQKSLMTYKSMNEFFYNNIGDMEQLIVWVWNSSEMKYELNSTTNFYYRAGQAIESVAGNSAIVTRKLFRDGQVLIQKGDKTFTLTGQEVK